MSTKLPPKSEFENAPEGSHLAICYRVIDLGTQLHKSSYGDETCPTVALSFELPHESMKDGRPFSIYKRFKLKSGKKSNLRKFLEAWRGAPFTDSDYGTFDLGNLLGKPCLLGVVHDVKEDNTYVNISSVMRITKGMDVPPLKNEILHFTFDDFNQETFNKLSENIQAVIAKSPEYQQLKGGNKFEQNIAEDHVSPTTQIDTSEIPF